MGYIPKDEMIRHGLEALEKANKRRFEVTPLRIFPDRDRDIINFRDLWEMPTFRKDLIDGVYDFLYYYEYIFATSDDLAELFVSRWEKTGQIFASRCEKNCKIVFEMPGYLPDSPNPYMVEKDLARQIVAYQRDQDVCNIRVIDPNSLDDSLDEWRYAYFKIHRGTPQSPFRLF
jgi:hypothetical protein